MDCSIPSFTEMVKNMGEKVKLFYSAKEVAAVLGISESTVRGETNAGRTKYHLPSGRQVGKLYCAEWIDEWIKEGIHDNG